MKRLCAIVLSFLFFGCMFGCRAEKSQAPPRPVSDVMSDVLKSISPEHIDTTLNYNDQKYTDSFEDLYDFSHKLITDGGISYASSGGYADEITILYARKRKDISAVKKGLEDRVDTRTLSFNGYKPKEVLKLQQAEIFTEGQYVCLVISDNPLTVKAATQKAIIDKEGA